MFSELSVIFVRPQSLKHVESQWSSEVRHFCRGVPVILVANKTDLRDDPKVRQRLREEREDDGDGCGDVVTREETRATAGRIRAEAFVECSALRGDGVQEVFKVAAKAAITRRKNAGKIIPKIRNCQLL